MKNDRQFSKSRDTAKHSAETTDWQPPELDVSELQHRFGDSVLLEFIRGHNYSAILRELAQNEYDAGGSELQIQFGTTSLQVSGNGTPIDGKGWKRLSVTLGTGSVPEFNDKLNEKANGIGSKNFGLRSLFLFGDQIYVRSNGKQTLLDLRHGTPRLPSTDTTTTKTRGIQIHVPYRTESYGPLDPFTVEAESEVLDDLTMQISLSLLKLSDPSSTKSLKRVIVTSANNDRKISWIQKVRRLNEKKRGIKLLARRVTMTDSKFARTQSEEEFEWQRRFKLPDKFRNEHIPGYFRDHGQRIKIGISLRTKKGKLDSRLPAGIAYYPIGVEHAYTGNCVSISAPFEMDADRSALVDPSNSAFNEWLLDLAADMTVELLRTDWFDRFGANVYRAVGVINQSALPKYSKAIEKFMKNDNCWPSRSRKRADQFASIQNLSTVASPSLDHFLDESQYLHPKLYLKSDLHQLSMHYGAKKFTVNSLVRLRCAGEGIKDLLSICKEDEANYYYTEFPESWNDLSNQLRCAAALDMHLKKLSKENRRDLAVAETTLTANTSLAAAENLWFVPNQILNVCPIPAENRLHPELSQYKVLRRLCKTFNVADWIKDVTERLKSYEASENERNSLYKFLLSISGKVPRNLLTVVRNSAVLRDRKGNWVTPKSITAQGTIGIRRFRPALHLPHRDYVKNKTLARVLRFKTKITGDDVVRFAEIVAAQPEMAQEFEKVLERSNSLLTARTINRLASIEFIRSNDGRMRSPSNLYLDTSKNRACIGLSGPYPVGKASTLFAKLKCHSHPTVNRIVEYLTSLRESCQPPPRPNIIYPELVVALKRESTLDFYKNEEILWTGNGYSAPDDTLLAGKWERIFFGNVPTVKTSSAVLKQAYQKLGVHDQPKRRHWKQFLETLGRNFLQKPSTLSIKQKNAVREAYRYYPHDDDESLLPSEIPWLLDEVGQLHTTSDAESGSFVIEDDVPLGNEIRKSSIAVSFADNSNARMTSFFYSQGVKNLTEVASKVTDRIGEFRSAPNWFIEENYIRKLRDVDFGSALVAIATRDYPQDSHVYERVQETVKKLGEIEHIKFVNEICTEYRVGGKSASVPAKFAWINNCVHLVWVRSKNTLVNLLALLISRECNSDIPGNYVQFSDSVFRLFTCDSSDDIREYLECRGIRWDGKTENNDVNNVEWIAQLEEAVCAAVLSGVAPSATAGSSQSRKDERTEHPDISEHEPGEFPSLPPIDAVNARFIQPNDNWVHSPGSTRKSTGSSRGGRWSLGHRNEERDREIGHRGEEIVYILEKDRVRKAGHSKDRVVWVSKENPASDYDIESVDEDGETLFIEVKTTTGSDGNFYWSMSEFQRAVRERNRYILYRVYLVGSLSPVVCPFRNPVDQLTSGGLFLDIASLRAEVQSYSSD